MVNQPKGAITMSKYYPILEEVSDFLDIVPHPKATDISKAIRVWNDENAKTSAKVHAVAKVILN